LAHNTASPVLVIRFIIKKNIEKARQRRNLLEKIENYSSAKEILEAFKTQEGFKKACKSFSRKVS